MEDDQNDRRNSEPGTPSAGANDDDLWARAAALARRDSERAQARELGQEPVAKTK